MEADLIAEEDTEVDGVVERFLGKYWYLSNFYPSQVVYDEVCYPTSEHAYQAAKTLNPKTRDFMRKMITPKQAKMAGNGIKLRPNWEAMKHQVMFDIVLKKFCSAPYLLDRLLKTEGLQLVEGNLWHDNHWGTCHCRKTGCGNGENWLGKILMKVRDEIIQVYEGGKLVKRPVTCPLEGVKGPYEN